MIFIDPWSEFHNRGTSIGIIVFFASDSTIGMFNIIFIIFIKLFCRKLWGHSFSPVLKRILKG